MKIKIILFFILCLPFFGISQYDPSKVPNKVKTIYDLAIQKAQDGDFNEAIRLLQQSIKEYPNYVDAYLSLAGVYGQSKNNQLAVITYEKAFAIDSNYTRLYKLPYSINLAGAGEFSKALEAVEEYLSNEKLGENSRKAGDYRRTSFLFALEMEKKNKGLDYVFDLKNLGDEVNSAESEYFPSLTIDGSKLVFTRRLNRMNEDFFVADRTGPGWTKALPLGGNVNTPDNEGAQMISQDGEWLVFTACNRPQGYGSCDIYLSVLTPDGWSEAMNLGGTINTEHWDSQPCLSPDKKDLYFTSRRPGGLGGSDIYVSHLQPNGKWSEPENLGPLINTKADEACPFIHADNQTLYFTSNGLTGYGEDDIFYTRKGPRGDWSLPQNLGYPINTIYKEGTLFIAADGKTAYYASDRSDSKGGLDIYTFELRENVRPYKTFWVKGKVFDKKTLAGLPSTVELIDLSTRQPISRVQTDEKGNYLITLPVGKDYLFNVNRKGYLFFSDQFLLRQRDTTSIHEKNIPLVPIEADATVVLRNIFFDFNKYELKAESQAELDKVIQLLSDNPTIRIEISGHTDNIGSDLENKKLSENRAKAVVNYLVENGIVRERLTSKGYGSDRPVSSNETEEGRAMNRRTELKVVVGY